MRLDDAPIDGPELFPEAWEKLDGFAQRLWDEGEERGLIGPRELPRLWSRHILNCTAINDFIPDRAVTLDVGSGAGLPGIVLAMTRPDVHVHLVEAMERRVDWLKEIVDAFELPNVVIHNKRAEDLHGEFQAQVVTARAVAALKKLVPLTMPLLKPGGTLVALKGARAEIEIEEAVKTYKKNRVATVDLHQITPNGTGESTNVVIVAKR